MILCEWFALCTREAAGTVYHPVLGDVPTCDRCRDKADPLLTQDECEAAGVDGTGRDGDARFPHRLSSLTPAERERLGRGKRERGSGST